MTGLARLRVLETFGCKVSLLNFLPDTPLNHQIIQRMNQTQGLATHSHSEMISNAPLSGIPSVHEILPFQFNNLAATYPEVLKAIQQRLMAFHPDFVITAGDSLIPTLAASLGGFPGAHCFHSQDNIDRCLTNHFYLRLFRKWPVICNSAYLQAYLQQKLGVYSDIWHPIIKKFSGKLENKF